MKRILLLALLMLAPASAHEFWLEPETFRPTSDSVNIHIKVGMNYSGDAWGGDLKNIVALPTAHGTFKDTLMSKTGLKKPKMKLPTEGPGQYLVGFNNKNSYIKLGAKAFEKYVISEGLQHIVAERKKLGESGLAGKENYQRCAKVLVQKGPSDELCYGQMFGFPAEIEALTNPYGEKDVATFQVLAHGEPLPNATVMVWNKIDGKFKRAERVTDGEGKLDVPLTRKGKWMITAVYMERAEKTSEADWQSYWLSYGFGFE